MTALGCFGSVIYHDPKGRRCGACSLLESCKTAVATNEAELGELMEKLKASDRSTARARKRAMTLSGSEAMKKEEVAAVASNEKKPAATVSKLMIWSSPSLLDASQGLLNQPFSYMRLAAG